MYTPIVKNIEEFEDGVGSHIVTRGTLQLIPQVENRYFPCLCSSPSGDDWRVAEYLFRSPRLYYRPIIVSKYQEPLYDGDYIYNRVENNVGKTYNGDGSTKLRKVLVLPNQNHMLHLKFMIKQGLRDGDDILVKCSAKTSTGDGDDCEDEDRFYTTFTSEAQNQVTFFPVKTPLEKFAYEHAKTAPRYATEHEARVEMIKAGAKWAWDNPQS